MSTNVSPASAELTQSEIADARDRLEQARDRACAAMEGLSEAQWNYRPASGGWTVAGIVEHMVIVQELILGPIAQALAEAPEAPSPGPQEVDAIIKTKVTDRSRRFQAPEVVHPKGQWKPAESLERMRANTGRLIQRLETAVGLRRHQVPSRPMVALTDGAHQTIDGYQILLLVAGHTDRHTLQILEVKAEAGFPAN